MFDINNTSDFKTLDTINASIPYYDIDLYGNKVEVLGFDALDAAIENLLLTEPFERYFEPNFYSPVYEILFKQFNNIDEIVDKIYDKIEMYVPVSIDRSSSNVKKLDAYSISFQIVYTISEYNRPHTFNRVVGK
ncbi:MAG: hypothetical protein MJZ34_10615 [Paludibacteraceae bacterium]|nr:hypothetical protein [Paludibacteraceae bacterium]